MNAIVKAEHVLPMTATDVRSHVNLIQEVLRSTMKEGTHYGKIPGTEKPSLWKPGAEQIAMAFRIGVSYRIDELTTAGCVRFRVVAVGTHQGTGTILGEGIGECSSNEEKYKWRKAYQREFNAATESHRRIKYGWNNGKKEEYEVQQIRTEPADLANTILKMACKRAQVAMTLNVTAASDIFTQDIEDLPEDLRPDDYSTAPREPVAQPQSKSGSAPVNSQPPVTQGEKKPISPGALKTIRTQMVNATLSEGDARTKFGHDADGVVIEGWTLEALTMDQANSVLSWIKNPTA